MRARRSRSRTKGVRSSPRPWPRARDASSRCPWSIARRPSGLGRPPPSEVAEIAGDGLRQPDRGRAQNAQEADAQGRSVSRDEASGRLREAVREAEAETDRGPKEAAQGDATNGTRQRVARR